MVRYKANDLAVKCWGEIRRIYFPPLKAAAQINAEKRAKAFVKVTACRLAKSASFNHPASERILKAIALSLGSTLRKNASVQYKLHKPKTGFPFNEKGCNCIVRKRLASREMCIARPHAKPDSFKQSRRVQRN